MEATEEKNKVHHGKNLLIARSVKGLTQDAVSKDLGMHQSDYSKLEKLDKVDIDILKKAAEVLKADIKFLTDFVADETITNYNMNNHDYSVNDQAKNIELEYNNSIPESVLNKSLEKNEGLLREIADLRVILAKNGIDYPQEKQ